jgi:hypothetical protein
MEDTQKEVIEKLLVKVENQQKVITRLVCYLSSFLGSHTVNELLDQLRQQIKEE